MTPRLFAQLAQRLDYTSDELLRALDPEKPLARLPSAIPRAETLLTQRANPQRADFRDYTIEVARPWALRCQIATDSPYFRFGFKLLGGEGRPFGDMTINSFDANLLVHIGRNNWDRPQISANAVFFTAYMTGQPQEEDDRFLFLSERKVDVPIELTVDRSYRATFVVGGRVVLQRLVPASICNRVVMYGWSDREEFRVEVRNLTVKAI